jgi:TolB-like protein
MAFALPDKPSLAVLPFDDLNDDPEQEYFVDGMTDDLITDLSKHSGLFVIARNSVFTYKGQAVKVQRVAEELGVRYVLEGSVRRAGDQVRINAQLIDAVTGGHLWAERYDGSVTDVFALQDRVARNIVTALAVRLTGEEQSREARTQTENPQAYDAFLRGWGTIDGVRPMTLPRQFPTSRRRSPSTRTMAGRMLPSRRSTWLTWSVHFRVGLANGLVCHSRPKRSGSGRCTTFERR